ncbi:hypothetical protein BU16DRAFT_465495 [Lophium mytilinum]|uniref:Uncharacterized protein n=1 Tax=Lophium mytilinum TaxID=390894 RepID=A0A6A6QNG6_9PEZI|nr:hypothetical protein BU16DRAFT_465495 [Lophium mytilinum]
MRTATTPSQSSIASASTPVPQEFGNALAKYPHEVDRWNRDKLIETKYYRDTRYMSIDHEYDYLWQEHQFMSTGNVRIPGENGKNASLMSISMFHQMHCLATMRVALQHAREGLIDIGVDWRDDAHWPHCFDYLRSTIMCYADGTLEQVTQQPGPNDDGKVVKVIDGGVETRHCRDTRPLYQLERQYGPHSQYGHENDDFQVAPGR